jgi:hypothetical protein
VIRSPLELLGILRGQCNDIDVANESPHLIGSFVAELRHNMLGAAPGVAHFSPFFSLARGGAPTAIRSIHERPLER